MRTCDICSAEFAGRADARYCSPTCRQRAYRERHAPPKPKRPRPALEPQALKIITDLLDATERLEKLMADDRFKRNAPRIAERNAWRLEQAHQITAAAIEALGAGDSAR